MQDAKLQARVTRLRQIIAEAVPVAPSPTVSAMPIEDWQRYQHYVANDPMPTFDTSERARKTRNINRIACSYGWVGELQRILDSHAASCIQALEDDQVEAMHERFVTLEACYLDGCDLPDGPHAR